MSERWDLLFKDALIFDGSESPPTRGDVAVGDGVVEAIGQDLPAAQADRVIDAKGKWVMPGMVDIHTHYDLEVELHAGLPESVRHGTTTVVMANCSIGVPFGAQRFGGADPIVDCFARVENIPKHVLRKVADRAMAWNDSAGYLAHLNELPLGPNLVPMIPHSMLRIEAMGFEPSIHRDPTTEELQRMESLLEDAMSQGYAGFSTDALPFHYLSSAPNLHKRIPTQYGSHAELKRLTGIVRRHERVWQATPPKDDPLAILRTFLLTSGRLHGEPLKLTAVAALDLVTNRALSLLGRVLTRVLNSRLVDGIFRLQALAAPFKVWSEGAITPLAEEIPELRRLNEPDLEDRAARMEVLHDPEWRADFKKMWHEGKRGFGLARIRRWLRIEDASITRNLGDMYIETCPVGGWSGLSLEDIRQRAIAHAKGTWDAPLSDEERAALERLAHVTGDDADFFLELLEMWDTDLYWHTTAANADPKRTRALMMHPLMLPGFSDAGAHLTNMAFYDVNLRALQLAQQGSMADVAYTVRRLTREPAEFFDVDAGRLEAGAPADVVMLDPDALRTYDSEANLRSEYREAFDHHQLVNRSEGVVPIVVIGGKIAWEHDRVDPSLGHEKMGRVLLAQ